MEGIDTIIFDVGRVLVGIDTSGEKFSDLAWSTGIPPDQAFAAFSYNNEVRDFCTGKLFPETFYLSVRDRYNILIDYSAFREAWCDLFHPMPGMEELFGRLSRHYSIGLLSDTDPLHWEHIRSLFPWLAEVEKPTLSFEVGYLKPHPAMFRAAAANCGKRPDQCLFIDDLRANVDGARLSGMQAIVFEGVDKLQRDLAGLGIRNM